MIINYYYEETVGSFSLCHFIFSSLYLSATLYFIPSFSISAITQSVIYGIPGMEEIEEKKILKFLC